MKKIILASILTFVLSVVFVPTPNAQTAKEGTVMVTMTYTFTTPVVPLDLDGPDKEERSAMMWEFLGVTLSDTGKGPFHNMSNRGFVVLSLDKGEMTGLLYAVWTDPDGDQVFDEVTVTPQKTIGRFLGGTGKFVGIEGTAEVIEEIELKPSKENTSPAVVHIKIDWKLP